MSAAVERLLLIENCSREPLLAALRCLRKMLFFEYHIARVLRASSGAAPQTPHGGANAAPPGPPGEFVFGGIASLSIGNTVHNTYVQSSSVP